MTHTIKHGFLPITNDLHLKLCSVTTPLIKEWTVLAHGNIVVGHSLPPHKACKVSLVTMTMNYVLSNHPDFTVHARTHRKTQAYV